MTELEFNEEVNRLMRTYGEKVYTRDRLALYWSKFKYTSRDVFKTAIDICIGEYLVPPSISKIQEAIAVAKKNTQHVDPWEQTRTQIAEMARKSDVCPLCYNNGVFEAHRNDDPRQYHYCFGCSCPIGDLAMTLPENKKWIRQWNPVIAQEWEIR